MAHSISTSIVLCFLDGYINKHWRKYPACKPSHHKLGFDSYVLCTRDSYVDTHKERHCKNNNA